MFVVFNFFCVTLTSKDVACHFLGRKLEIKMIKFVTPMVHLYILNGAKIGGWHQSINPVWCHSSYNVFSTDQSVMSL